MKRVFDHSPTSEKLIRTAVKKPAETHSKSNTLEILVLSLVCFYAVSQMLMGLYNFILRPCG